MPSLFRSLLGPSSSTLPPVGGIELPLGSAEPLMNNTGKELDLEEATVAKCNLRIEGMTCGSCVEVRRYSCLFDFGVLVWFQSIEGMLRPQAGIHSIKVALLAERGLVEYDPTLWSPEKLVGVSGTDRDFPVIHPALPGNIRYRIRCDGHPTNTRGRSNPPNIWYDVFVMYWYG